MEGFHAPEARHAEVKKRDVIVISTEHGQRLCAGERHIHAVPSRRKLFLQ